MKQLSVVYALCGVRAGEDTLGGTVRNFLRVGVRCEWLCSKEREIAAVLCEAIPISAGCEVIPSTYSKWQQMILRGNDPYRGPSFSLGNRLRRALWNLVYLLLFRISPRPFHRWRVLLLRLFGGQLGRGCHIYPSVSVWAPWNIVMGNHVGVADGVTLYSMDQIRIGDYAVISQGAHLCCGSHDYNSANFQLLAKPIVIGKHAWVCAEAFIHPGAVVPDGAVVGARAVVTKSLLVPWAVYAGNPCRQVGSRKSEVSTRGDK